jgi:hypothetical protein
MNGTPTQMTRRCAALAASPELGVPVGSIKSRWHSCSVYRTMPHSARHDQQFPRPQRDIARFRLASRCSIPTLRSSVRGCARVALRSSRRFEPHRAKVQPSGCHVESRCAMVEFPHPAAYSQAFAASTQPIDRVATSDESFTGATETAQAHSPGWTDDNRSDPGVTLLQLFCFLGETLTYRANALPERHSCQLLEAAPGASHDAAIRFHLR